MSDTFKIGDKVTALLGVEWHKATVVGFDGCGWIICKRDDGTSWYKYGVFYEAFPVDYIARVVAPMTRAELADLIYDVDFSDFEETLAEGFCDVCPESTRGCRYCAAPVVSAFAIALSECED